MFAGESTLVRERLWELERTVRTLADRVQHLQRQAVSCPPVSQEARLWPTWRWRGVRTGGSQPKGRGSIRENRRIPRHASSAARPNAE